MAYPSQLCQSRQALYPTCQDICTLVVSLRGITLPGSITQSILVTNEGVVTVAIVKIKTELRVHTLTCLSMRVAAICNKANIRARHVTVDLVGPLAAKHTSQFGIRQFQFTNRVFRQLSTLFVAETLTIKVVLPCTNDTAIHRYYLSLHRTLLLCQDANTNSHLISILGTPALAGTGRQK
jgi:hypothetical protein